MTIPLIVIGLLGAIVGSFLNVLILRLHTGRSATGRSGCMSCKEQLSWRELIPMVSFIFLRGRCTHCGSAISHQYWIVEVTTALLFMLVWMEGFSLVPTLAALVLTSLLVVIAAYDVRHTIIPNEVVYVFIALAFLTNLPLPGTFAAAELPLHFLFALVSGLLVAAPLLLLWLISRGQWMGLGDVKLAVGFGFILGTFGGLMAIMWGFILGALVGVVLLYAPLVIKRVSLSGSARTLTMKSEIPFAPFLIVGFFLVLLFDLNLFALIDQLFSLWL